MTVRGTMVGVVWAVVVLSTGMPVQGQEEWQQGVEYVIEAELDEASETVRGRARFTYTNRSPDRLDRLYFHQHLNAFRPNSTWATSGQRPQPDFTALEDPDHAFERMLSIRTVAAGGGGSDVVSRPLRWSYPGAPDSTVVEVPLLDDLEPGEEITLELNWLARPSTVCRRQCRGGRHYDFAQWYPRIAPYDEDGWAAHPLYPQGEFYGSFGTYDVTLDLEADQVVGATGVPIEGNPGWGVEPVGRDFYGERRDRRRLNMLAISPEMGRKRVRFYAEDVHHFAWTTNPEYIHEGGQVVANEGRQTPIEVHVLYRPGDEEGWGSGQALERTVSSLEFLEDVFGPYPWPQLTNVHRLEGGGTEFPMMIMNGSASEGLILHETAHQYAHGIFGNNEWKEAWLDEGFASFLVSWAFQDNVEGMWVQTRDRMAEQEAGGFTQPMSTISDEFESFGMYGYMAYTRGSFFFRMLQGLVGEDVFRQTMREYYERWALHHVTEESLRTTAEAVSGEDLEWFFEQWLHTTGTLDYAIGEIEQEERDGQWRTRVEVLRTGEAWMPVTIRVGDEERRLDDRGRRQRVEFMTDERPTEAILDP
ncbi:MAG: M1 family metallopeptidase, partial [Gemmatimonadota bacterium]|nr:M1 family metallopeptidase [Gemmatimonadota bacterium]